MKGRVDGAAFKSAMGLVEQVVDRSRAGQASITSSVLIELGERGCILKATDNQQSVIIQALADVAEPGALVVAVERLALIVREVRTGEDVILGQSGSTLKIRCHGNYTMQSSGNPDDFAHLTDPMRDVVQATGVNTEIFSQALSRMTPFVAPAKDAHTVFYGIALEMGSGCRLLAGDRNRFIILNLPFTANSEAQIVIPKTAVKTILEACRIAKTTNIAIDGNYLDLILEGESLSATVSSLLLAERYPNLDPAFESYAALREPVIIKAGDFAAVVRQASILAAPVVKGHDSVPIFLRWDETGLVGSGSSEIGAGESESVPFRGTPLARSKVNADFLTDWLSMVDPGAEVSVIGDVNGIHLATPGYPTCLTRAMTFLPGEE
jgi:DNA polymerase III sliding clamp (beta) subunit (PCNA family)